MGLYPFDAELGLDPSGSLVKMLDQQGKREVTLATGSTADYKHDQAWHVSGSGSSWIPVFSASVNASAESHFRQSLINTESIIISCDYLGEYWVRRRDWFDSTIFDNKYVKAQLKHQPTVAAALALCISSVLIVRGLKITYTFQHVDDTTVWSSWDAGASGGCNIWGWNFGLSGGASGSDWSHVVNTNDKSVTFMDGPEVCRLIALRASTLISGISEDAIAFFGKPLEDSAMGRHLIQVWRSGDAKFGQMPRGLTEALQFKLD
jgi:hypothetical protein